MGVRQHRGLRSYGMGCLQGVVLCCLVVFCAGCGSSPSVPAKPAAPARPELTNVYRIGPDVDLLAAINVARDSLTGVFRVDDGALLIPAVRAAQLNLTVELPDQYSLELDVARTRGDESLNLGIVVGGRPVMIVIEGWGKGISGLNRVDGRLAEDNVTSSRFPVFPDRKAKTIRVIVRKRSVLADVNGNVFLDFRGDPSRLSFDDRFFQRPHPNQLMVGGWNTEFRVTRWTLTPLGDQPPESAAEAPTRSRPQAPREAPQELAGRSSPVDSSDQSSSRPTTPAAPAEERSTADSDAPRPQEGSAPPSPADPDAGDATEDKARPASSVVWTAAPDPYPGWNGEAARSIEIPISQSGVLLTESPSPFFARPEATGDIWRWKVFDVRTGMPVGEACELPPGNLSDFQLCPSGRYLRSYEGILEQRTVVVHSFVTGRRIYEAESPVRRPEDAEQDLLIGRHALLQVRRDREGVEFRRIDLETGRLQVAWRSTRPAASLVSVVGTPGGRYLLANWNDEFEAYDAATGEIVGRLPAPPDIRFAKAMAFSWDGSQLAMLGYRADRESPEIWRLDWESSATLLQTNVRATLHPLQNNYVAGPWLEWFPDEELLLYFGRDVIDARTGRLCYRIPGNSLWQVPCRPLPGKAVLRAIPSQKPGEVGDLRSVKLPGQEFAEALRVVREGGIADDVGLPPITVVRETVGTALSLDGNPDSFTVSEAAAPSFPDSQVKLPQRLAQFREHENKLQRLEAAAPDAAVVVSHFTLGAEDDKERRDVLVRHDLKRGKASAGLTIRSDFRLAAVSPSGDRALIGQLNSVGGMSRLDVVDLLQRKHVAGWRPYDEEPYLEDRDTAGQPAARNPMTATYVGFLDEERVLTLNPAGKLRCWRLPDCAVVFSCEDFGRALAVSADRRYLLGARGPSAHLLDVANGTWAGRWRAPEGCQTILRGALAPDLRELVLVLAYQGRRTLLSVNLIEQATGPEHELPVVRVSPAWNEHAHPRRAQIGLKYRRPGYLTLDDLYLVDRARGLVAWRYQLTRGVHVANPPDRREWFTELQRVSGSEGQRFEFWLAAADAPSDEVVSAIAALPSGAQEPAGYSILSAAGERVVRSE